MQRVGSIHDRPDRAGIDHRGQRLQVLTTHRDQEGPDLLAADGVFIFEVSYLMDIIDRFLFDTVYHEHLSYHSIEPFAAFFKAHGLHLFDVQTIPTKGGSIRGFVQRLNGPQSERQGPIQPQPQA